MIDLRDADVTVQKDGETLPVSVVSLAQSYGSEFAINIVPDGWAGAAGESYAIDVAGISEPFEDTIDFVDCGN